MSLLLPALVLGGLYLASKGSGQAGPNPKTNPAGYKYTLPDGSTRYYDSSKLAPGTVTVISTETDPAKFYAWSSATYLAGNAYDDAFACLAACNFYRGQQGKAELPWPPTYPYPG